MPASYLEYKQDSGINLLMFPEKWVSIFPKTIPFDKCWVQNSMIKTISFQIHHLQPSILSSDWFYRPSLPSFLSLSASPQTRLVCHVLHSLWIQEWNWQCRTATVPRGTWCPPASAVSESQPVLNESLGPNPPWQRGWSLNPDGNWTLGLIRSHIYMQQCTSMIWKHTFRMQSALVIQIHPSKYNMGLSYCIIFNRCCESGSEPLPKKWGDRRWLELSGVIINHS